MAYAFFVGKKGISWKSKCQSTVAQCTTMAEYLVASLAAKEGVWWRQRMADMKFVQEEATTIMIDLYYCPSEHEVAYVLTET